MSRRLRRRAQRELSVTHRHRLFRGGHRQANAALYRIVTVRMRWHEPTMDGYAHAKEALFHYIEVFYNQRRRHSTLGQIRPAEFERRSAQAA